MPSPLQGRFALVTGSSSGIGRAIARRLAQSGCHVLIHYAQSQSSSEAVVKDIQKLGLQACTLQCDLSKSDNYASFVEAAFREFPELSIWVNNAGADLLTGELVNLSYHDKLQRLWEVDVRGTVELSRLVGVRWQEQAQQANSSSSPHLPVPNYSIINIGWDQADRGMEGASAELFAVAKNGIMGFTRALAKTLAPEVRVNCIAPGWIKTAWGDTASQVWQDRVMRETPLKRWGTPEDIANMAHFLASDEASFITGQVINVNGGAVC
jgi:3-oxoacyl-[acyl-carrier protein] reductase